MKPKAIIQGRKPVANGYYVYSYIVVPEDTPKDVVGIVCGSALSKLELPLDTEIYVSCRKMGKQYMTRIERA